MASNANTVSLSRCKALLLSKTVMLVMLTSESKIIELVKGSSTLDCMGELRIKAVDANRMITSISEAESTNLKTFKPGVDLENETRANTVPTAGRNSITVNSVMFAE